MCIVNGSRPPVEFVSDISSSIKQALSKAAAIYETTKAAQCCTADLIKTAVGIGKCASANAQFVGFSVSTVSKTVQQLEHTAHVIQFDNLCGIHC